MFEWGGDSETERQEGGDGKLELWKEEREKKKIRVSQTKEKDRELLRVCDTIGNKINTLLSTEI